MDSVRLDKWLWAARCYKTRQLAAEACVAGHVQVNAAVAKPAKAIRVGDSVEARTPGGLRIWEVSELSDRRGSADLAKRLYIDHSPPPPPKEARVEWRDRGIGRPSKRDRRLLDKLRGE